MVARLHEINNIQVIREFGEVRASLSYNDLLKESNQKIGKII